MTELGMQNFKITPPKLFQVRGSFNVLWEVMARLWRIVVVYDGNVLSCMHRVPMSPILTHLGPSSGGYR